MEKLFREIIDTIGYTFEIPQVVFETRVEGTTTTSEGDHWKCAVCGKSNPISQKECDTLGCVQWKPKQVRDGDWMCCGINNYASRSVCMKCGNAKNGNNNNSNIQPSAPQVPSNWWCSNCRFEVYGSKASCKKCGSVNPAYNKK